MSQAFFAQLIGGAIVAGMPILLAALGELVSERAGVLNIGLEGMMLVGAYVGFVAAYYGGFSWLGFGAGMLAGALTAVLMVVLCVQLGLDQIVVGIAITLSAEGIASLVFDAQFAAERPSLESLERVSIPGLADLPAVGGREALSGSLFSQPLVVYLTIGLVLAVTWMLRSTHQGLNIRAAGDQPAALDAAGVSVTATRAGAVLFAGAMAGLGGAYLSLQTGVYENTIVGGRGFIAIVFAMLARGRPVWVVVGALLFGASLSISDALQIEGIDVPIDVVFMLPFVVVMIVLVVFGRRAYLPAALGVPYVRGAR